MKCLKLMLFLLAISCGNINNKYDVVSNESIDKEKLEFAKLISHKILNTLKVSLSRLP